MWTRQDRQVRQAGLRREAFPSHSAAPRPGVTRPEIWLVGWLWLSGLAGCQSVGFSASVGSDPGGTGSDIASTSPARSSRSGQAYGRSGRARLRGSDDSSRTASPSRSTADAGDGGTTPDRSGNTIRPIRTVSLDDAPADDADPLPDPDSAPDEDRSRSLPVTSDDPSSARGTRRIPD